MAIEKTEHVRRRKWGVGVWVPLKDRDRFAALDRRLDYEWNGVPSNTIDEFESELCRDGLKIEE